MENTPKKLSDEETKAQARMELIKSAAIIAVASGVSSLTTSYILRETSLTDGAKAMIQMGAHIVLGGATMLTVAPRIGVGIIAGGCAVGAGKADQAIRTKMYLRQLAQPQNAPAANNAPQVGAGTAPAAQAYAPAPQRAHA
jgi:hypothetical protein